MPLPARSCCVSSAHRVFCPAILKLSCQQDISWKGFSYSLSTLHHGCPGFFDLQATYQPLCCSAQDCWHPWVLPPGEKWPMGVPCLASQPSTGISRLGSGCWVPSSSGLPDLAAHPDSWGLAEHWSSNKGTGSHRFGTSTMETILYLQGMMNVFSFRMGKTSPSESWFALWKHLTNSSGCRQTTSEPAGVYLILSKEKF